MSGILSGLFATGGQSIGALVSGGGAAIIQGIVTGSTRQIVWPIVDQLGPTITGLVQSAGLGGVLNTIGDLGLVSGLGGYVAILEEHNDELEITQHPVQQGATISDHAYKLPARLSMQIGWTTSSSLASKAPNLLGALTQPITPLDIASLFTSGGSDFFIRRIYSRLLSLQAQRSMATIYTGKRVYNNMLLQSLSTRTAAATEHCLIVSASFHEVILAKVTTVTVPTNPDAQKLPQDTGPVVNNGPQQPAPAPEFNPDSEVIPPPPAPPPVPPPATAEGGIDV